MTKTRTAQLIIENHDRDSVIVRGQTYPNRQRIKSAVTDVQPLWRDGGWVFPKTSEVELRRVLDDLLVPIRTPAVLTIEMQGDDTILVRGETFPHRAAIKAAVPGTKPLWDAHQRAWIFAREHENQLRRALSGLVADATPKAEPQTKSPDLPQPVQSDLFQEINTDVRGGGHGRERNVIAVDRGSQGSLANIPAEAFRGAGENGSVESGAAASGGFDVGGDIESGGGRLSDTRSLGDDAGTLLVSTGRDADAEQSARRRNPVLLDTLPGGDGVEERRGEPRRRTEQHKLEVAGSYVISEVDGIGVGGAKTKFRHNMEAIRTVKQLQIEQRGATLEEQRVLVKYVGWGGLPQAFYRPDGTVAAGWETEAELLKQIFTEGEYAAARRSTQDAHYTSDTIIQAIYDGLARLGVEGGRILEPSLGVGHFFGLAPMALRENSTFVGIELDPITGQIAKALYPNFEIQAPVGFQDVLIPDGHFDVVIGNPPFGSQRLYDPNHKELTGFSIHNYFFAKSIHSLRPGGVLAMVVSSSLMDKIGDNERAYLAERTELLGAIRLPNTAFKANAGTEVTTDILFLQRRDEHLPARQSESWVNVEYVPDTQGRDPIPVNEYFARHPNMMLGTLTRDGSMYRADMVTLQPREGQDLTADLAAAVKQLPERVFYAWSREENKEDTVAFDFTYNRVGSYVIGDDGRLARRVPDVVGVPKAVAVDVSNIPKSTIERIAGMIKVRDVTRALLAMELQDAPLTELAILRERLNAAYDNFVKRYGYINDTANQRAMREDPDFALLSSLESRYDKGVTRVQAVATGEPERKPSATKAAIFERRVLQPHRPVERVETAKEALIVSLAERGGVDFDHMQRLTAKDSNTLIQELRGLIFDDPAKGWTTAEEYLSGNVKHKLAEAKMATDRDSAYRENVEALERVQPRDLEPTEINTKPGAPWLPSTVVEGFAVHLLGGSAKPSARYIPASAQWTLHMGGTPDYNRLHNVWGTQRYAGSDLLLDVMNNRPITVFDTLDDKRIYNEEATALARLKASEIGSEFQRWIWSDAERRDRLARMYNDKFNTDVPRTYDGAHLQLPGKIADSVIALRPHQKNAIWRAVQSPTTLFDHVVGAGKTFTIIGAAMEMRRLGLARKPMIVVPNHLVQQWAKDFSALYPGANVLATTKADFDKEKRQRLFARIATGDWDAVIVAHSSFKRIPVSPEEQATFIKEQVADIKVSIQMLREAEGKNGLSVKQMEKRVESLESKLERLLDSEGKDKGLNFTELGVDALFVDEAHEFKNLGFSTTMRNIAGLGSTTGSEKAADLFMKARLILARNNGRGVIFATGTPISNSMSEMYTMQRYLAYDELARRGVVHFDAWANMYGDVVSDFELDATGVKYKLSSRFSRFVNLPELMSIYNRFSDSITRDDINALLRSQGKTLPVPKVRGGGPENVIVPRSPELATYMEYLVWRAENMPDDPSIDNMLKVTNEARKAALDMRTIHADYSDFPESKSNRCVQEIVMEYHRWGADKGAQLVFIDLSTPKGSQTKETARFRELIDRATTGDEEAAEAVSKLSPDELLSMQSAFSVYDDIRAKLTKAGIPDKAIAFIHDADTDEKKETLFSKVRSGDIRILLGSTGKMGAGMNVQERLVALHHLDCPWRPSDLEQREGRIIRQGNKLYDRDPENFEVRIIRYATEQTYDARMWQTIEAKARLIEQIRCRGVGSREVEDIGGQAASAAEMKAAATGNPLILEEVSLRTEMRRLEALARERMAERHRLENEARAVELRIAMLPDDIAKMRTQIQQRDMMLQDGFAMNVNGVVHDKRKIAGEALLAASAAVLTGMVGKSYPVSYAGLDMKLRHHGANRDEIAVYLNDSRVLHVDRENLSAQGLVTRIENVAKGLDTTLSDHIALMEKLTARQGFLQIALQAPVQGQDELNRVRRRHADVMRELNVTTKGNDPEKVSNKPLFSRAEPPIPAKHGAKLRVEALIAAVDEPHSFVETMLSVASKESELSEPSRKTVGRER